MPTPGARTATTVMDRAALRLGRRDPLAAREALRHLPVFRHLEGGPRH